MAGWIRRMMEISFYRGHPPFRPPLRIDSIALSGLTFVSGVDAFVGLITTYMSTSPFTGSLAVGGADAASFKIVGSNLVTNGTVAAGTYSITLIATQATANNSPFTSDPLTITGTPGQSFVSLGLSNATFTPDGISAVTVGTVQAVLNPASPASTATIALGGTNAASFQLTNGGVLPCAVQAKSTTGTGPYTITLTATQVGIGGSPFPSGNIGVTGSTAVVTSVTFANKSASNSPAVTPMTVTQVFARTAVPSGSIAVPTISGSALTYQADSRTYWDDGSLRVAVFRCLTTGAINGGTSAQITFPISAGSYSNASAFSTANMLAGTIVTNESDFKLAFTNVHTATFNNNVALGLAAALTVSAGAITGGHVYLNGSSLSGTVNVTGGGGTGGQVSISGTTMSLVAGGSGYTAPASATSSFNSIVASGAAKTIVQYAKGPVCDAWRVRQPLSGMPHFHCSFYVERWKDSGGSFLAFKAYAVYGSGLLDTGNALPNYTFDLDWKNGSTVLRGVTNADPGFSNICCYAFANGATFKRGTVGVNYVDSARPDWCNASNGVWASDAVVSAIIQQRTATECDQLKATGLISPWLAITPTITTPTVGSAKAYVFGSGVQDASLAIYQPFASAGLRCPFGTGGSDETEAPIVGEQALHWMWLRQSDTAKANIWLVQSRVACAHGLGTPETGAGFFDTTNVVSPCVIPNTTSDPTYGHNFSGMTQNSNMYETDLTWTGYLHPVMVGGGSVLDLYHQPCYALYAYLHDGEQWMLDAQYHSAATPPYWLSPSFSRQVSLGSTTYYGLTGATIGTNLSPGTATNVRNPAWLLRSIGYSVALMPTTWADGSSIVETSYVSYLAAQQPTYLNALISFSGTVSQPNATVNKTRDLTGSGIYPELVLSIYEIAVPFMDDYEQMVYGHLSYLLQGTTAGTQTKNFWNYRKDNYHTKLWAYSGSHYLNDTYRLNVLDAAVVNAAPSDSTYSSEGDVRSPGLAMRIQDFGGNPVTMAFSNGSSTVTLSSAMSFRGATRIADGSRIKLTATNINGVIPGPSLPTGTGIDNTTWYYWKELSSVTGRLCTDAGLTLPITPTSSVSGVWFWVVPSNTLPADNSGAGTYVNGTGAGGGPYLGQKYGTIRGSAAFERALSGSIASQTTNAIANLATIFNSVNTSPTGDAAFGNYVANAYDDAAVIG